MKLNFLNLFHHVAMTRNLTDQVLRHKRFGSDANIHRLLQVFICAGRFSALGLWTNLIGPHQHRPTCMDGVVFPRVAPLLSLMIYRSAHILACSLFYMCVWTLVFC
jgi:hypothetical protein